MPGRVNGAWNLISKLAIALIWKTPTSLKFGKTKICQKQNILTFVYNKTGVDSSEWFEPAKDAASSSRRRRRTRPVVYVAHMVGCPGHDPPPFGKIGSTSRPEDGCRDRLTELQTGNPFRLVCDSQFPIYGSHTQAERKVRDELRDTYHLPRCSGGREWFQFPQGGLDGLVEAVHNILHENGYLTPSKDWVESSINPSLSPNQPSQFVYISKWRQVPCKGDELQHIKYNCKWHFSEVTCVTIARSRKWSIKCRYSNKRRTLTENNFISATLE